MSDTLSHSETVRSDLGGCLVMHRDFASAQAAGYWELADELRARDEPVFFNLAQGYSGVHAPRRGARHLQDASSCSSESITPWQPDPIYRFVPTRSTRRTTSSTGGS